MKTLILMSLILSTQSRAEFTVTIVNSRAESVLVQCSTDYSVMSSAAQDLDLIDNDGEPDVESLCDRLDEVGYESEMDNVVDACRSTACDEANSGIQLFQINEPNN